MQCRRWLRMATLVVLLAGFVWSLFGLSDLPLAGQGRRGPASRARQPHRAPGACRPGRPAGERDGLFAGALVRAPAPHGRTDRGSEDRHAGTRYAEAGSLRPARPRRPDLRHRLRLFLFEPRRLPERCAVLLDSRRARRAGAHRRLDHPARLHRARADFPHPRRRRYLPARCPCRRAAKSPCGSAAESPRM